MKQYVSVTIGGEAGFGIMASGTMLIKAYVRHGYHAIASNDYPSLIRGGHNVIRVGIGTKPFAALAASTDILVALNAETITLHAKELHAGSYILYDEKDSPTAPSTFPSQSVPISLPFAELVKTFGGDPVMRNTVALGAVSALIGMEFSYLADVIETQFGKKGPKVVEENKKLAQSGYDAVKNTYSKETAYFLDAPKKVSDQLVINGSEAVGLGAVDAGMKFAAIYPMTPINALISLFSDFKKELGVTYIQPEDEIAGMNMALGASVAGLRSMVATSGGGFSLMVEGLSLAGIAEIPIVIDLGMRPGPATGMPTYTEQGELLFSIFAGHGEFPRVILAPGDISECYTCSKTAFDTAWQYQIPAFILTDKYLNETQWTMPKEQLSASAASSATLGLLPSKDSKRYALGSSDGVSKEHFPGNEGQIFLTNSYEHDEDGLTTEDATLRRNMVEKRAKKLQALRASAPLPTRYGAEASDITFVSFGSTKGPILAAMELLEQKGIHAALLHFSWVYPLNTQKVMELLQGEKRLIDIEGNSTGQLAKLLKMETGVDIKEQFLKYDGRQWGGEEIVSNLKL